MTLSKGCDVGYLSSRWLRYRIVGNKCKNTSEQLTDISEIAKEWRLKKKTKL